MAIITKSIGTASRDYSTIQAWQDALPADLVADGNSQVGECYNDSEFVTTGSVGVNIDGHTTDASHTITLKCAAGQSFKDHAGADTNPLLYYDQTRGVGVNHTSGYAYALYVGSANVIVDGLQFFSNGWHSTAVYAVAGTRFTNCIAFANFNPVVRLDNGGQWINSIIITQVATEALKFVSGGSIVGGTVVRPSNVGASGNGILGSYGTVLVRNTAVFGFSVFYGGSATLTGDHNATDLADAGSLANSLISLTYADQFVQPDISVGLDLRLKTGSALIGAGVVDTTSDPSATSIVGVARGGTWDISAWEAVVAGTPPTAAITVESFSGHTVTISGTTANVPLSGTVTLTAVSGGAVTQSPAAVTLGSGTHTVDISNVPSGTYSVSGDVTNAAGSNAMTGGTNITVPVDTTASTGVTMDELVLVSTISSTPVPALNYIFTTDGTNPETPVSGLDYAFFDQSKPSLLAAPTVVGTNGAITLGGAFHLALLGSTLVAGQDGYLILGNADGDPDQDPTPFTFSGPVRVS